MIVPGRVASRFQVFAGGVEGSRRGCASGSGTTIGRSADSARAPVLTGTVRETCGTRIAESCAVAELAKNTVIRNTMVKRSGIRVLPCDENRGCILARKYANQSSARGETQELPCSRADGHARH